MYTDNVYIFHQLLYAIHKVTKCFSKSQVSQGYSNILNDTKFRSSFTQIVLVLAMGKDTRCKMSALGRVRYYCKCLMDL